MILWRTRGSTIINNERLISLKRKYSYTLFKQYLKIQVYIFSAYKSLNKYIMQNKSTFLSSSVCAGVTLYKWPPLVVEVSCLTLSPVTVFLDSSGRYFYILVFIGFIAIALKRHYLFSIFFFHVKFSWQLTIDFFRL